MLRSELLTNSAAPLTATQDPVNIVREWPILFELFWPPDQSRAYTARVVRSESGATPGREASVSDAVPRRTRPVQARVLRNSELMLDAAMAILAEEGWAQLTIFGVARRMGLSERPVRNRVSTRSELAALVWRERVAGPLTAALDHCREGLDSACAREDTTPLAEALCLLNRREPWQDAAGELLILGHFLPDLALAIEDTVGVTVRSWLDETDASIAANTTGDGAAQRQAARLGYTLCLALGILLGSRLERSARVDLRRALDPRIRALVAADGPCELPDRTAAHVDLEQNLAPEDAHLDALLNATLRLIARYGFDGVTVRDIAAEAGFTEGLIFHRYRTKMEMVLDATRRQNQVGWQVNHEFFESLERDFGPGIAEGVTLREFMRPSIADGRAMALEQVRLTWHDEELAEATRIELDAFRTQLLQTPGWEAHETEDDFYLNVVIPYGAYVLPLLVPQAHLLAWAAITVPLQEHLRARTTEIG